MREPRTLKEFAIVKLTVLVGACRDRRISKKIIEEALERAIQQIREFHEDDTTRL